MNESEHEPEQDLEALQDHSDRLGEEISEARDDWETKKADPAVPGADGEPEEAATSNPLAELGEQAAEATGVAADEDSGAADDQ